MEVIDDAFRDFFCQSSCCHSSSSAWPIRERCWGIGKLLSAATLLTWKIFRLMSLSKLKITYNTIMADDVELYEGEVKIEKERNHRQREFVLKVSAQHQFPISQRLNLKQNVQRNATFTCKKSLKLQMSRVQDASYLGLWFWFWTIGKSAPPPRDTSSNTLALLMISYPTLWCTGRDIENLSSVTNLSEERRKFLSTAQIRTPKTGTTVRSERNGRSRWK